MRVPFSRPTLGEDEINEVVDTLKSGWLTTGPKVKRFEDDFGTFIGCEFALAVNSATAGLHLALEALGIKSGDKVITTTHTFTATAEVIQYLGATPVFADIQEDTFNISPIEIERLIHEHEEISAIIVVPFGGQSCDMHEILALSKKYNFKVLVDAAHALPATYRGEMVGLQGDITVYSFYANKTLTTGEGGMIVTANSGYFERMKVMRLHGINKDVFDRYTTVGNSWAYQVVAPGYKYNMTDIAASIGIHQLKQVTYFRERREEIAAQYHDELQQVPLVLPSKKRTTDAHAWHLYVVRLKLDATTLTRDEFISTLSAHGIGTSVHYIPLHMHPYWKDTFSLKDEQFPVASKIFNEIVSLPIYPSMSAGDVRFVIDTIKGIL